MSWDCLHLNWLVNTGHKLTTTDGKQIAVLEFRSGSDDAILSGWAKHFRNHYCPDTDIDTLRSGYGYSRADYLKKIKFPDSSLAPGPSIRAGDFGEILIADYLEYRLKFWVPRTRYGDKTIRNESTKGCDIIGFRIIDPTQNTLEDTLVVFEAKTQFASASTTSRLQDAVADSKKDPTRKAESLNAIKQRLLYQGHRDEARRVDRFQNFEDHPYKEVYGAVALFSTALYDPVVTAGFDAKNHPAYTNLVLLVIHGADMMTLVNELYRRAADEA